MKVTNCLTIQNNFNKEAQSYSKEHKAKKRSKKLTNTYGNYGTPSAEPIYIYVIGAPERTEKNKHTHSLFKEMMT